jgi:ParB-like chromosome segregation protein Spo0J
VSDKLLEVYAEDGMTLDQLMAFTVNPDHARQEQVWEALQRSHTKEPYQIRRMLTEDAVHASDKRVQFVGIEAYEAAGGHGVARPVRGRGGRLAAGSGPRQASPSPPLPQQRMPRRMMGLGRSRIG